MYNNFHNTIIKNKKTRKKQMPINYESNRCDVLDEILSKANK